MHMNSKIVNIRFLLVGGVYFWEILKFGVLQIEIILIDDVGLVPNTMGVLPNDVLCSGADGPRL